MALLRSKHRLLKIDSPIVMGILNVTPDSFHEGSRIIPDKVVETAEIMLNEGAGILDIGGQSTRPGATQIGSSKERDSVLPVIESLRNAFPEAWISIDTYHAEVAQYAIEIGADIVNDIWAGLDDPNMLEVVSKASVPYIAMHKKGIPESMQNNPIYENPIEEIIDFFIKRLQVIRESGIVDCIIDPGFGFGKTQKHNFQILSELESFKILDSLLLIGVSRKSMVWKTLNITPEEALNGSTFLHAIALQKGANILRVHDVKAAKECVVLNELV